MIRYSLGLILLSVLAFLPVQNLQAQQKVEVFDLSATTYATNAQTITVTSTPIKVNPVDWPNYVIQVGFKLASTGTSNVVFGFNVSMDNGVTYSTTTPITVAAAGNGTTAVVAPVIFGTNTLYRTITHIDLTSIQNYNGVNVTNITVKARGFK